MTVLSIDSGNIHTNEKFAATGLITDATMNPLFCEFWGEWGAHPGGVGGVYPSSGGSSSSRAGTQIAAGSQLEPAAVMVLSINFGNIHTIANPCLVGGGGGGEGGKGGGGGGGVG